MVNIVLAVTEILSSSHTFRGYPLSIFLSYTSTSNTFRHQRFGDGFLVHSLVS